MDSQCLRTEQTGFASWIMLAHRMHYFTRGRKIVTKWQWGFYLHAVGNLLSLYTGRGLSWLMGWVCGTLVPWCCVWALRSRHRQFTSIYLTFFILKGYQFSPRKPDLPWFDKQAGKKYCINTVLIFSQGKNYRSIRYYNILHSFCFYQAFKLPLVLTCKICFSLD